MTPLFPTATVLLVFAAGTALAGDAAQGEKDFTKCRACHSIIAPDGDVIVKGGISGPNLWGVVGRPAGAYPEYKYTDAMAGLGERGLVWTPQEMADYIPDARGFLQANSGDDEARTSMTPQKLADVTDVIAYLARFGPAGQSEEEMGDRTNAPSPEASEDAAE